MLGAMSHELHIVC